MTPNPELRTTEPATGDIETKVIAAFLMPFYSDLAKWRQVVQQHFVALRAARAADVVDKQALAAAAVTRDQLDIEIARFDAAIEHLGGESSPAADQLGDIGEAFQSLRLALMKIMTLMGQKD